MTQAITTIGGVLAISIIFIYLSIRLKEDNKPLKLLFLGAGIFNLWTSIMLVKEIAREYISGAGADNIFNLLDTVYKASMYIGIFFLFYIFIMFIHNIFNNFFTKKEENDIWTK